jgi:hypothetical protein
MPLHPGKSPEVFSQNVSEMMHAGHPQAQALAAAYREKRQSRDMGGSVGPDQSLAAYLANALNSYSGGVGASGGSGTMSTPASSAPVGQSAAPYSPSPAMGVGASAAPTQAFSGVGMPSSAPIAGPAQATPPAPANPVLGPMLGGVGPNPTPAAFTPTPTQLTPPAPFALGRTSMNRGGVPGRQMGGQMPWFSRQEARGMMHSGPVNSIVPGRTDRHNVSVPSGSYVFPSDFVSHLGQNNSAAGHAIIGRMFGGGGPYGAGAMPIKHGSGAPRPPKMMGAMSSGGDAGGGRGSDEVGKPVDVVVAGGENIVWPDAIQRVTGHNIKDSHHILDQWVMKTRAKHIKTLKGLPPPAKA